ncbi:MAG TPA: hypothetical protein VHB99_03000, partial [Pirellulales bacterium]|nr:hypothetical protein [Pirellulales bacterium]
MSDEQKQPPTSATIKVLEGTVKTMKITDNAALGMGAIENVLPGVTKAAAATLSESAPIIGPIAGKTVGFLGRWGGRVAVPLQLVVGTGEAIYHGVKGQYEDMGGDIGGTVGGIGGGIAVGAAIGSVVPGVGTVIGGAIGGVIGYFGGEKAGRAIAGHFVASAAAAKSDKQAAADLHTVFEKQAKQPFHFAGDPETPPAPPPAKTPAGAPQNAFT